MEERRWGERDVVLGRRERREEELGERNVLCWRWGDLCPPRSPQKLVEGAGTWAEVRAAAVVRGGMRWQRCEGDGDEGIDLVFDRGLLWWEL